MMADQVKWDLKEPRGHQGFQDLSDQLEKG